MHFITYLVSAMAVFRRLATSHIFERSNLAGHATPESQPRFVSPKNLPCFFEIGAGLLEAGRGSVLVFARMAAWMETAMPLPRIFVMRVAAADRDRAGEHVTIVDMPAFPAGVGRSAAGEFGHCPSKRGIERVGKLSYSLSLKIRATLQGIQ